jgi:hypothetical protein
VENKFAVNIFQKQDTSGSGKKIRAVGRFADRTGGASGRKNIAPESCHADQSENQAPGREKYPSCVDQERIIHNAFYSRSCVAGHVF